MDLSITFRHLGSTEAIKDYVAKKTAKFEKIVTYQMNTRVAISVEKSLHCIEISCHAEFHDLVAITKTNDLYEAIDLCSQKMASQLKKLRDRKKANSVRHQQTRGKGKKQGSDLEASLPHSTKKRKDVTA